MEMHQGQHLTIEALHSTMMDAVEKLSDLLKRLATLESEMAELKAEVTMCIALVRNAALAKAAAVRATGVKPEAWQEETANPGGSSAEE